MERLLSKVTTLQDETVTSIRKMTHSQGILYLSFANGVYLSISTKPEVVLVCTGLVNTTMPLSLITKSSRRGTSSEWAGLSTRDDELMTE